MKSSKKSTINEKELIRSIQEGNDDAFKTIYSKYYVFLCAVATDVLGSSDDCKDVVQEVFLGIWKRRQHWRPEGPLKPYLYRSVYNRALNYINKEKSKKRVLDHYSISRADSPDQPIYELEIKELSQEMWKVIKQLPKRRYLIFILHKVHGLKYKEVADTLGISIKTVDNQMGLALKFLRDELEFLRDNTD
jgi:RNA polymerase sigma-70 factor, ECF subfamily